MAVAMSVIKLSLSDQTFCYSSDDFKWHCVGNEDSKHGLSKVLYILINLGWKTTILTGSEMPVF